MHMQTTNLGWHKDFPTGVSNKSHTTANKNTQRLKSYTYQMAPAHMEESGVNHVLVLFSPC